MERKKDDAMLAQENVTSLQEQAILLCEHSAFLREHSACLREHSVFLREHSTQVHAQCRFWMEQSLAAPKRRRKRKGAVFSPWISASDDAS